MKQKISRSDYGKLILIVAKIDTSAQGKGYHSSSPEPFLIANKNAWDELDSFMMDLFELTEDVK